MFNGNFSINRLYHAIGVRNISCRARGTTQVTSGQETERVYSYNLKPGRGRLVKQKPKILMTGSVASVSSVTWGNDSNAMNPKMSNNGETRVDIVAQTNNHATLTAAGQVATCLNARLIQHGLFYQLWRLVQLCRHRWHQLHLTIKHRQ